MNIYEYLMEDRDYRKTDLVDIFERLERNRYTTQTIPKRGAAYDFDFRPIRMAYGKPGWVNTDAD